VGPWRLRDIEGGRIMEIKELMTLQKDLDNYIIRKKELQQDPNTRLTDLTLAMMVECSEFANETKSFKYWKKDKSIDKEKTIEEYVDILFFWLSIGNQLGFTPDEIENAYQDKWTKNINRQDEGY